VALSALPALLLSFHAFFTVTVDDSRFWINTDPEYAYLLSAIDLSRLSLSRMVMHPGTTVQCLSHLFMRARFGLFGSGDEAFSVSVLKDPGRYLNLLHHAFSLINVGLVWLFGMQALRITRSLRFAVLCQSTPFLFAPLAVFGFRKVTSDVVLVSVSLGMAWLVLKTAHLRRDCLSVAGRLALGVAFGVVVGFGIATKINFVVMAIIPLILIPSLAGRVAFVTATAVVFRLIVIPVGASLRYFKEFALGIMTHRGIYGRGAPSLVDVHDLAVNLFSVVKENLPFCLLLLFSASIVVYSLAAPALRRRQDRAWKEWPFRALVAVTLAQVAGVLMVARHFKSKYLIPALALSVISIYLLDRQLAWLDSRAFLSGRLVKTLFRRRARLLAGFLILSLISSGLSIDAFYRQRRERLREASIIQAKLEGEFRGFAVVYYYNAASPIYGLKFGNDWTPLYARSLAELYGEQYFYDHAKRIIHGWRRKASITIEGLKAKYHDRIVFYGTPFPALQKREAVRPPEFSLQDITAGRAVTLYRYVD
jgi:hypothetical protein